MNKRRRKPGWVALVAVLVYGLAPLLAAFSPNASSASPTQCAAKPEAHSCACRPDPHGAGDCCCKPGDAEGGCRLNASPCSAGEAHALSLWTSSNPLPEPQPGLRIVCPRPTRTLRVARRQNMLTGSGAPVTPPPQTQDAA